MIDPRPEVVANVSQIFAAKRATERGPGKIILQSSRHKAVVALDWQQMAKT